MSALEAAKSLLQIGLQPLPLPHKEKRCLEPDWPNLILSEDQLRAKFNGAPQNIGVLLGQASENIVDVDLDWSEAGQLAPFLLPDSWTFGRNNELRHVLVRSPGVLTTKFDAPLSVTREQRRIVEILATGKFVMVPPSTHPNGQMLAWMKPPDTRPIAEVDAEQLVERVSTLAACALLVRLWADLEGTRHDVVLSLAGALHHAGWPHRRIEALLTAVLRVAVDTERRDRAKAVSDTLKAAAAGKAVTGLPRLAELLPHDCVEPLKQWLRLGSGPTLTFGGKPAETVFEWPDPDPLPLALLPVQAFEPELLPASLQHWCSDISDRLQCPLEFPAVAGMVSLASIIGRKAGLRPKRQDDWTVVATLWGMLIGRPAVVMKSPATAQAMRVLKRLEHQAFAQYQAAKKQHDVEQQVAGLSAKAADAEALKLLKSDPDKREEAAALLQAANDNDDAPVLRRYIMNNASVEAIGELLQENPFGMLLARDELAGWLRNLEREDMAEARAFFLQAHDGTQSFTFDRIMRGKNLRIEAPTLSIIGGIQPGRLRKHIHGAVTEGSGDDGLVQRFSLMVWPDAPKEWKLVDRWPDNDARQRAFDVFQRLDELPAGTDPDTGAPGPQIFQFDPPAQDVFNGWMQDLQAELRRESLHPAMESHLAKYPKTVCTLALVIALADGEAIVSEASILRALAWIPYLRSHAERVYAAGTRPDYSGASALLRRIQKREITGPFAVRDIYRNHWANLATPQDAQGAVDSLVELGYLRREERPSGILGGRPTATYHVSPKAVR